MPADGECDASICSTTAPVGAAVAGLFRKELGGQVVIDWCLALALLSTLMPPVPMCVWLLQPCQHQQHHVPGADAVPEDGIAKEMGHHLVMNFAKIAPFCSRAGGREGTTKEQLKELRTLLSAGVNGWEEGPAYVRAPPP